VEVAAAESLGSGASPTEPIAEVPTPSPAEIGEEAAEAQELEPPPPTTARAGGGTATLGDLYLSQGHTEEAAEIFRGVLANDPDNAAARAGLERLELDAAALLRGSALQGLTEKKVAMLRRYLSQLRQGAELDVP
jgi:hypothetical protein